MNLPAIEESISPMGWIKPEYLGLDWESTRFPQPHEELDRDEFDLERDHGTYGLAGINYDNTVYLPDTPEERRKGISGWTVHYYFYPFKALAIVDQYVMYRDYCLHQWLRGRGDFLSLHPHKSVEQHTYGYARRYFKIGCRHNWKELTQKEARAKGISHYGSCYHVRECLSCGIVWSYDSSG